MSLSSEFADAFEGLSENEQRAVTIWIALHRDYPELFPLFDFTNNATLLSLTKFIDLFTTEHGPIR